MQIDNPQNIEVGITSAHVSRLQNALKAAEKENLTTINGEVYMRDARGALLPRETIKPQDLLIDEQVRRMFVFAHDLSAQIGRFKGHCFEDIHALQSLLEQEYSAKQGGKKGNVQFVSFDGTKKITIQIADQIYFGAELQTAKTLIDECLLEWGAGSHEVLRAIVNRVFSVEKTGQINRAELFSLLRVECDDPRWQEAMRAIKDSIRVLGTKSYIRFYFRENADSQWRSISLDIANV